jgi:hypothetical protein
MKRVARLASSLGAFKNVTLRCSAPDTYIALGDAGSARRVPLPECGRSGRIGPPESALGRARRHALYELACQPEPLPSGEICCGSCMTMTAIFQPASALCKMYVTPARSNSCPLRLYRIAIPVTNVAFALSELTDPTLSSLRSNSLVRRPSMTGVKTFARAANVGAANTPWGATSSDGSWK